MLEKMIFIVGSGRCGTSWIQHWMLQHPHVCGQYNESKMFDEFQLVFRYPQKIHAENWMPKANSIFYWFDQEEFADIASDFAFNIFDKYCQNENKTCVVEKTPRHFWVSESINRLLAHRCEVYFIHLYRDGRNVIESFLRQDWCPAPDRTTALWVKEMEFMLNGDCPDNMIHIRYEDLIQNTESESRKISSFCKLDHQNLTTFETMLANGISGFDPDRWKLLENYGLVKKCYETMEPTLKKLGYIN